MERSIPKHDCHIQGEEMNCEACNNRKALTTPVSEIVGEVIDMGKRFLCDICITKPSDVLARMIRERGEKR